MPLQDELLALEERFWTDDAEFYRQHLDDESLMVFADPVGVLTKEETVRAISAAPRWRSVRLEDARLVPLAANVVILTYRATAQRGDAAPHVTRASSAYVRRNGSWCLAFHQQTPQAVSAHEG